FKRSYDLNLRIKNMLPDLYAEDPDFTSDMLIYEKTYTAELSSIAGTPIEAGPFDTVVLFKINYN
ncbi:hypothetical protein ACUN9W_01635, partial [Escherichia coli]